MKQRNWVALLFGFAIVFFGGLASAHVTVWPKETKAGAFEKYTVRVPVEKNVNTMKVRLVFPEGVTVESVEPVPGWNYSFEKGSNGENIALIWTATNGGIKPNEFQEFSFQGKNTGAPNLLLSWKAYQTYQDGTEVQWIEGKDGKHPASVTVLTGDSSNVGDNHIHSTSIPVAAQASSHNDWSKVNIVSLVLAGIAILFSIWALFRTRK